MNKSHLLYTAFLTLPVCSGAEPPAYLLSHPPATFLAPQPDAGPGGSNFKESAHFRVYNADQAADKALALLEGAYQCFVDILGWRSTGLSIKDVTDKGPWFKTNAYAFPKLSSGNAGQMHASTTSGMGWFEVNSESLNSVEMIHELGHMAHYHQKTWVDQSNTGAWWETVAQWFADTYNTSPQCAAPRRISGKADGQITFDVKKILGDSFQVIVDGTPGSGNYYQAWPFLTYLSNNPDEIAGLGRDTLLQMMLQYKVNSNETPLHVLQRVAGGVSAGQIVGNYWRRMAYVDIGHAGGKEEFKRFQATINYSNVVQSGNGYTVKPARAPRYMGANFMPLKLSGNLVTVKVTSSGSYTASLAIKGANDLVRYVTLTNGAGSANVSNGEQVTLVIANTPKELIMYNGFNLKASKANEGMKYSFTLTGATVAST